MPDLHTASCLFSANLNLPALAHLRDHYVRHKALLPGAALFELAAAATRMLQGMLTTRPCC